MASQAQARQEARQQPEVKPIAPDSSTQTEWAYPRPDRRLIQPITSVDVGNRPANFVLNKVILPWRNMLAFYENILIATVRCVKP
jgi:hypothetical protein